jgi:hypothetical protein
MIESCSNADPGSGVLFTSGFGMKKKSGSGMNILDNFFDADLDPESF